MVGTPTEVTTVPQQSAILTALTTECKLDRARPASAPG